MKKTFLKTRVLCIMIALLLVFQTGLYLSGSQNQNAYAATDGDFEFDIVNGTAVITAYTGTGGAVAIPSTVSDGVESYSVTSIGEWAFYECDSLTGIIIPSSVISIGDCAFLDCYKLMDITISTGVKSIGECALADCISLESISIPTSVTSIGADAFSDCDSLTSIIIPASVTSIGAAPLSYCDNLSSITVANGNTKYTSTNGVLYNSAKSVLIQCPGIKAGVFTIPSSVTRIGDRAFSGCNGLTSIIIPSSVTSIGFGAIVYCGNLISITIPSSVTNIEGEAIAACNSLKAAYFLGNAPTMGEIVFYDCADAFKVYYLVGKTGFTNPWHGYTTVKSAQVKFNSQGGSAVGSAIVNYSALVKAPTSPNKAGYTFAGWYKDSACTDDWNFSTDKATANITLYAKWRVPINSAVSNSYNSIKVSWSGAGSATSYRIYRATSATGTYTLVHTSASTTRYWIDTTEKITGKTYYYKVRPVVGGTEYKFNTYKYAKAIPATPTVTLNKYSSTSIKVSWSGVSGGSAYQIYRATSATGTYTYLHTSASTTRAWVDTGRTPGKTYYYKVRAYHVEGTTKVYGISSATKYLKI